MSELDSSKLNPLDPMRKIDEMRAADMQQYTDPKTGLLRSDYSELVSECPACGVSSTQAKKLFQKDAFVFYECNSCSHVFVNPRLNDLHTGRLYSEGRCYYQTKHFYLPSAEYRKETIYSRKLAEIEQKAAKGKLLDFGSSTGYFMQTAKERGWDVCGVELNPFGVEWAREKLGLENVYNKDINDCGFSPQSFDVITMWDVLEHIPNPFPILKTLHSFLKPDGTLVAETSHFDCLETDLLGKDNTNIVGDMHVMHFTSKSLTRLLERAGFKTTSIEIFGLDLRHILNLQSMRGNGDLKIPESYLNTLQACVDKAKKGCYIKAYAQPCK